MMSHEDKPARRLKSLDLLRLGLALLIMVTHTRRIFEIGFPVWLTKGPLDGKGGVVLFFVLSGYVLTKSLAFRPISWEEWRHFVIKRVFRLFPLFWVALVLASVVLTWIKAHGGLPAAGDSLAFLSQEGQDWRQWLLHIPLVVPGMQADFVLPTVWSLMTEAKVSLLVFPFLGWAILRLPWWGAAGMTAMLALGSDFFFNHIIGTAAYLGMFALGALLARVPEAWWRRMTPAGWCCLLLAGLAAYSCMSFRYQMPSVWIGYYLCALGAVCVIACAAFWPSLGRRMHSLHSLVGVDLSYGVYLLHYPVLLMFFKLASGMELLGDLRFLPALAAMGATVALAWILAHLVEIPMVRLGRLVAGKAKEAGTMCVAERDARG